MRSTDCQSSATRSSSERERRRQLEHSARRVAEQLGRDVEEDLVDQARREQRAVEPRAGFDVELVDAAARELAHQRRQVDAPRGVRQRERVDTRRPAGVARARGDDERAGPAPAPAPPAASRAWRSTTTRSGWRDVATARTVSSGSSASTVPTPVSMAQARARHAWPSRARRLAGDPPARAVDERGAAVEARRDLEPHPRQAARHARDEADVELARLALQQPDATVDAGGAQPRRAVRGRRIRIGHRRHDARDAGGEDRVDAGRRPAVVVAGLERHVQRAPRGSWPRARASASASASAWAFAGARVPALADHGAVANDHAADARIGRGRVQRRARASASARAIDVRSRSVNSVIAARGAA